MTEVLLIVNADDFGQSPGVNEGVRRCFEEGIVTSASLMVRWPAAQAAAGYARRNPALSVGLHVDLGEWTYGPGGWRPRYVVVDPEDGPAVEREIDRQLEQFRALMGANPSHLDGHQHVQRSGYPAQVLAGLAEELGLTLRDRSDAVSYNGSFYGRTATEPYPEGITSGRLRAILAGLAPGVTEVGCHPGLGEDVDSDYNRERRAEVRALCDPGVARFAARCGIRLVSHREAATARPAV